MRVLDSREPILTTNVQSDERFELSQSIIIQDIRSVIAVPLVARGDLLGALYVDTRMSTRQFDEAGLNLLETMASQAAMAIRSARLFEDVRHSNLQLHQALKELREAQAQVVASERLAAVGRLAASVAHELRSPLTVMRNNLYFLDSLLAKDNLDSPEILSRYFGKLDSEIERQNKIINDLLYFSRNRPRKLADIEVNAIITETLLRIPMPESISVDLSLGSDVPAIRADGDQIEQVFVNLLSNAIQAMPDGGYLTVSTRLEGLDVVAEVCDTGTGIDERDLASLFDPFFTTKEKGIGLGLSVTKSIVDGHRGEITVASEPGKGTRFSVRLPVELVG